MKGRLYLIPVPIHETDDVYQSMPQCNQAIIQRLDHFIVEDVRSARRFLSKAKIGKPIDSLTFAELNEHTDLSTVEEMLKPVLEGKDAGVISEAGVPCVADPGAELVSAAHKHGIRVVPLIGPSSIILALMASGLNGQGFSFNGYLPVQEKEKTERLKALEKKVMQDNQTQLFIETPYRNEKMFDDILRTCTDGLKLCIACRINAEDEFIRTLTIAQWKKQAKPDLKKRPVVFLLGL